MQTSFYEADPFTGDRRDHLLSLESDYRWEKGDEVWVETAGGDVKFRVTWVVVRVAADGTTTREVLGLRL